MALDAAMLAVLARELDGKLANTRIDKIYMPSRDEALLSLRTRDNKTFKLLLSARPGGARVHLTNEEFDFPATPPGFCMLLRKYIGHARLNSVEAVRGERVLLLHFSALAETGELLDIVLSAEMMGRYSNLVLVNGKRVVDALKRIDPSQSQLRVLLPGVEFTLPPPQDKLSFVYSEPATAIAAARQRGGEIAAALLAALSGIGPVVCREIVFDSGLSGDIDELDDAQLLRLSKSLAAVQQAVQTSPAELCCVLDGERVAEFSFIPLRQYGEENLRYFDSASQLLDFCFAEREQAARRQTRSDNLTRQVAKLQQRARRKHETRLAERERSEKADEKRLFGELLTANLHLVQKGAASVEVLNYYTGEPVTIPLDKKLAANANAQKYFKEYKKAVTAQRMLGKLLESDRLEIEYLDSVAYSLTRASSDDDFSQIRAELKSAGYLRNRHVDPKQKLKKNDTFLRYHTADGFEILAGRNNLQNERLSLKTAAKHDVWFHIKNGAGSHVVLICDARQPSDAAMTDAAMIAAFNSEFVNGQQAAVDYTEIKNVKKMPDGRAGMVVYRDYHTAYVTPNREYVESLADKKKR